MSLTGYPSPSKIIASFAPGWFASVMGTGVVSMTSLTLSRQWPWLEPAAVALHYFNFGLFALLLVPWLLRWVLHREAALFALNHPGKAAFYPTLAVAMSVLAAQALAFRLGADVALAIWWCAVLLTFGFNFAILYRIFMSEAVTMEHVTAVHFIPAVGLVVVPVAGLPLLDQTHGLIHDLALLVNVAGLGAGTLLYFGLFCLLFHRHFMHKPLPGQLVPTVWIQMAPIGWIPINLMSLTTCLELPAAFDTAKLFALLMWGAGLWWLVMAVLLTLTAVRRGRLHFSLAWWSFIFPLGALTTLSLRLDSLTHFPLAHECAVFLWALTVLLWAVTFSATVRHVISGEIFAL